MKQEISIVVATVDRPQCVMSCLKARRDQVPKGVEVIVVDAGHEQPVDEVALSEEWSNTRVIRCPHQNAGYQRNEGVRHATGEIVVFLDDDAKVLEGWWPRIVEPLLEDSRGQSPACSVLAGSAGVFSRLDL